MFWQQISANKTKTFFLMSIFFLLVAAVGWGLGTLLNGQSSGVIMIGALLFSAVSAFFMYYNSDKMVLRMANARPLTREEHPRLYDMIEGIALAAQLPMPKPYIIASDAMNAFATGRNPQNAAIAVTTGILSALTEEELEGVLAHEMSHIGNYDMLVMTLATVFAGAIGMLGGLMRYGGMGMGGGRRRGEGSSPILMVLALILLIVSPILATLIKLAMSRSREYLADASGAKLTRNPEGLARALAKISQNPGLLDRGSQALAPLMIVNPLRGIDVQTLMSTHPPIEERIRRLQQM